MIDTHTHLYMADYVGDDAPAGSIAGCVAAVERAVAAGVSHMVLPNVDAGSIAPMKALAAATPGVTVMTMGVHPTEIPADADAMLAVVERELATGAYAAVGEVGIDLYWDASNVDRQQQVFDAQMAMARRYGLPVLIHCREGLDAALEVLEPYADVPAVFHSFGGSREDVERIIASGIRYFGINGIVTFKNTTLREVLPAIPRELLLTETDAPFLAPVPHRGKRNESALLPLVGEVMARTLGMSFDELDALTEANARRFIPAIGATR